jgi:hypothetical protein
MMQFELPSCRFGSIATAKHNEASYREVREETPMLYIFKNNSGLQIAWNSQAPQRQVHTRTQQLDTRFSLFGFIRTNNAG